MCDTERLTDGIRRLCGVTDGVRDNEFAEATIRKAAVAEACDALDAEVEAARAFAFEEGRAEGRREAEAELAPRLMPEGMQWPKVEGEPVVIGERLVGYGSGDDGYEVVGVRPTCGWVLVKSYDHVTRDGGPVILEWDASKCQRPAPKVLDADGLPLREGETVWVTKDSPCDAPLAKGDEVTVKYTHPRFVGVEDEAGESWVVRSDHLTHERPDSWERLEEDATIAPVSYCVGRGLPCCEVREGDPEPDLADFTEAMARDIVRRAKALAERDA